MEILLTLVVVEGLSSGASQGLVVVPLFVWKFVAGPVVGWLIARAVLAAFDRLDPRDRGCDYVRLLGFVLLTYGLAELAHASGMLAVFTAGTPSVRHDLGDAAQAAGRGRTQVPAVGPQRDNGRSAMGRPSTLR